MGRFKPGVNRLQRLLLILSLLLAANCARAADGSADVVVITFEPAVADALKAQLDSQDNQSAVGTGPDSVRWTTGFVKSGRYPQPYRVVIGFSEASGQAAAREAADAALQRWQPRFLVRAGTAPGLNGSLAPRDVIVSRLVWRYEYTSAGLVYRHDESYRSSGAMITAAATLADEGKPRRPARPRWGEVRTGAIASGNIADVTDRALVAAILSSNPRTLIADRESAAVAAAVASARDRAIVVGHSVFFGVRETAKLTAAPAAGSGAEAVGAFTGELLRTRWPAAPR